MSAVATEILLGAVVGIVAVWWTHYAFASAAIKKAGLRLTRTFDGMFFTVPFFGSATPLWLNGRLPDFIEHLGAPAILAAFISMPVLMAIPFICYRLAAFLPGVVEKRIQLAQVQAGWSSAPGVMTLVTGIPREALR